MRLEVRKLPARASGRDADRHERVLRLRLAMTLLLLDRPAEALQVIEKLGPSPHTDKYELQRLAITGLSQWSAGDKARAVRELAVLLDQAGTGRRLRLRSPALVDRVVCYGKYTPRAAEAVRPGETVMAYVEVLNFRCDRLDAGGYMTALNLDLAFEENREKIDRRGRKTTYRQVVSSLPNFSRVRHKTSSPLQDLHLVIRFKIPAELKPGNDYDLRITVTDAGNVPEGQHGSSALIPLKIAP